MLPGVPTWPDEPEEENPEDRWPDPEHDLPSVPSVDHESRIPTVDPPDPGQAPEVQRAFWTAVIYANIGLAGVCIGPMIAYFRGQLDVAAAVFAVGLFGFARTYQVYRSVADVDEADESDRDPGPGDGDGRTGDGAYDTSDGGEPRETPRADEAVAPDDNA